MANNEQLLYIWVIYCLGFLQHAFLKYINNTTFLGQQCSPFSVVSDRNSQWVGNAKPGCSEQLGRPILSSTCDSRFFFPL